MVGFQTGISHTEQIRIFKQLPAFKNAVFVRLGQIHQKQILTWSSKQVFPEQDKQTLVLCRSVYWN